MNTNPLNLGLRFILEIAMLVAFGYWGWHVAGGWQKYAAAIGLPLIAAILWGVFRIHNDPKPAPVEIPGMARLLLEWLLFGLSIWALFDLGYFSLAILMSITLKLHYVVSYDRTWAMLRNRPYTGFVK